MFIGIEVFGSRFRGVVAFAGFPTTWGMYSVAGIFILGFFAQNVTFGRTDFFQHSPYHRAHAIRLGRIKDPIETRKFVDEKKLQDDLAYLEHRDGQFRNFSGRYSS